MLAILAFHFNPCLTEINGINELNINCKLVANSRSQKCLILRKILLIDECRQWYRLVQTYLANRIPQHIILIGQVSSLGYRSVIIV